MVCARSNSLSQHKDDKVARARHCRTAQRGTIHEAAIRALTFPRQTRGVAAVEFAIISPVFFLLLLGMMAYAIYFGAANSVQQLAADAARTSVAGLTQAERDTLVANFIDRNASNYLFLKRSDVRFTIGDSKVDSSQYLVTIKYDAKDLPIWNLGVPLPLPNKVFTYRSTIRKGGI